MNVAPVEFPARSVTMNIYVPSADITVLLVYIAPFNVAHDIFASEKVIVTFPEYCAPDVTPANVGRVVSMPVIIVDPEYIALPAKSTIL
jgi:hypothetical protein